MKTLLFVDTNILLDFYRSRTEAGLKLLEHLDSIPDQIVMTNQVEMEFRKNRQIAILESLTTLKSPAKLERPGVFSDAAAIKAIEKQRKEAEKRVKKLQKRLLDILVKPTTHDPVYKVVQRLFIKDDDITLNDDSEFLNRIRRQAFRRFLYGYPPRKKSDTSLGDAVNWEWIVHCAKSETAQIVIVSRDSDYGGTYDGVSYLNNFRQHEFKKRVSQTRKIDLYNRLSDALKRFEIEISTEENEAEENLLKRESRARETVSLDEMVQAIATQLQKRREKGDDDRKNDTL